MISRYHVTRIGASFLVGCGFSASPEWVIDRTTLEPISYRHFRFSREPPTPPWIPSVQFKLPQFRSYFRQEDQDSHTIPVRVLPAKCKVSGVEPRGFEPLTSAVQRQIYNVVVVRCRSEIPANASFLLFWYSRLFAVVRVGWCTNWCTHVLYETVSVLSAVSAANACSC
jgi:hypothetical protein